MTDSKEMQKQLIELDSKYEFDCVIANAGVSRGTLDSTPSASIENSIVEMFDINVYGVFNTIFPLMDQMRRRKNGQIVIMSSMASFITIADSCDYNASKVAVRVLGEGLRPLLAKDGVGCTVIWYV